MFDSIVRSMEQKPAVKNGFRRELSVWFCCILSKYVTDIWLKQLRPSKRLETCWPKAHSNITWKCVSLVAKCSEISCGFKTSAQFCSCFIQLELYGLLFWTFADLSHTHKAVLHPKRNKPTNHNMYSTTNSLPLELILWFCSHLELTCIGSADQKWESSNYLCKCTQDAFWMLWLPVIRTIFSGGP